MDRPFFGAGILFFDDALHRTRSGTHDAAIAVRIREVSRQQGELVLFGGCGGCGDQALQGGDTGQRHIAIKDQRRLGRVEMRQGLQHGMAGAELLFLHHPGQVGGGPPRRCSTLGRSERMRLPCPAARMTMFMRAVLDSNRGKVKVKNDSKRINPESFM